MEEDRPEWSDGGSESSEVNLKSALRNGTSDRAVTIQDSHVQFEEQVEILNYDGEGSKDGLNGLMDAMETEIQVPTRPSLDSLRCKSVPISPQSQTYKSDMKTSFSDDLRGADSVDFKSLETNDDMNLEGVGDEFEDRAREGVAHVVGMTVSEVINNLVQQVQRQETPVTQVGRMVCEMEQAAAKAAAEEDKNESDSDEIPEEIEIEEEDDHLEYVELPVRRDSNPLHCDSSASVSSARSRRRSSAPTMTPAFLSELQKLEREGSGSLEETPNEAEYEEEDYTTDKIQTEEQKPQIGISKDLVSFLSSLWQSEQHLNYDSLMDISMSQVAQMSPSGPMKVPGLAVAGQRGKKAELPPLAVPGMPFAPRPCHAKSCKCGKCGNADAFYNKATECKAQPLRKTAVPRKVVSIAEDSNSKILFDCPGGMKARLDSGGITQVPGMTFTTSPNKAQMRSPQYNTTNEQKYEFEDIQNPFQCRIVPGMSFGPSQMQFMTNRGCTKPGCKCKRSVSESPRSVINARTKSTYGCEFEEGPTNVHHYTTHMPMGGHDNYQLDMACSSVIVPGHVANYSQQIPGMAFSPPLQKKKCTKPGCNCNDSVDQQNAPQSSSGVEFEDGPVSAHHYTTHMPKGGHYNDPLDMACSSVISPRDPTNGYSNQVPGMAFNPPKCTKPGCKCKESLVAAAYRSSSPASSWGMEFEDGSSSVHHYTTHRPMGGPDDNSLAMSSSSVIEPSTNGYSNQVPGMAFNPPKCNKPGCKCKNSLAAAAYRSSSPASSWGMEFEDGSSSVHHYTTHRPMGEHDDNSLAMSCSSVIEPSTNGYSNQVPGMAFNPPKCNKPGCKCKNSLAAAAYQNNGPVSAWGMEFEDGPMNSHHYTTHVPFSVEQECPWPDIQEVDESAFETQDDLGYSRVAASRSAFLQDTTSRILRDAPSKFKNKQCVSSMPGVRFSPYDKLRLLTIDALTSGIPGIPFTGSGRNLTDLPIDESKSAVRKPAQKKNEEPIELEITEVEDDEIHEEEFSPLRLPQSRRKSLSTPTIKLPPLPMDSLDENDEESECSSLDSKRIGDDLAVPRVPCNSLVSQVDEDDNFDNKMVRPRQDSRMYHAQRLMDRKEPKAEVRFRNEDHQAPDSNQNLLNELRQIRQKIEKEYATNRHSHDNASDSTLIAENANLANQCRKLIADLANVEMEKQRLLQKSETNRRSLQEKINSLQENLRESDEELAKAQAVQTANVNLENHCQKLKNDFEHSDLNRQQKQQMAEITIRNLQDKNEFLQNSLRQKDDELVKAQVLQLENMHLQNRNNDLQMELESHGNRHLDDSQKAKVLQHDLEEKLKLLQKRLAEKEIQFSKNTNEIFELSRVNKLLERERDDYKSRMNNLNKSMCQMCALNDDELDRLRNADMKRLQESEIALSDANEQVRSMKAELILAKEQLAVQRKVELENTMLKDTVQNLEGKIQSIKNSVKAEYETEGNQSGIDDATMLLTTVKKLKQEREISEARYIKTLSMLKSYEISISTSDDAKETMRRALHASEGEVSELKRRLNSEITTRKGLEGRLERSEFELKRKTAALEEWERDNMNADMMRRELKTVRERNQVLSIECQKLKSLNDCSSDSKSEVENINSRLEEEMKANAILRNERHHMEQRILETQRNVTENVTEMNKLKVEMEQLVRQTQGSAAVIEQLQNREHKTKGEILQYMKNADALQSQIKELQTNSRELSSERGLLIEKGKDSDETISILKKEIHHMKLEHDRTLTNLISDLRGKAAEREIMLSQQESEIKQLKLKLESIEEELKDKTSAFEVLTKQIANMATLNAAIDGSKVDRMNAKIKTLADQKSAQGNEITLLRKRVEDLMLRNQQLEIQITDLEERLDASGRKMQMEMDSKSGEYNIDLRRKDHEIRTLKSELEQMHKNLGRKSDEVLKYKGQIFDLEEKLKNADCQARKLESEREFLEDMQNIIKKEIREAPKTDPKKQVTEAVLEQQNLKLSLEKAMHNLTQVQLSTLQRENEQLKRSLKAAKDEKDKPEKSRTEAINEIIARSEEEARARSEIQGFNSIFQTPSHSTK